MDEAYLTGTPLRLGEEPQLLIDDTVIEDRWKLTRVMHHPVKHTHNPVLQADKPWESDAAYEASVIWDETYGRYRMWYLCWNNSAYFYGRGAVCYLAYAESDDGVHWEKPLLDHCPYGEYQKTNIVYYGTHDQGAYYGNTDPEKQKRRVRQTDKSQIFKDDDDPDPARRYKMISLEGRPMPEFNEVHCGVNLVCSPDGIHWKLTEGKAILDFSSDCLNHIVRDPVAKRWLLICRPWVHATGFSHRAGDGRHHRRRIGIATSQDLVRWTYPRMVVYPDEYDLPDYDHNLVFRYGNVFLMLYAAQEGDTTGCWEIRLATSADGRNWERFHTRETYLGRGPAGSWDAGGVFPHHPPVPQGENLLFYYAGMNLGQEQQGQLKGGVGLAFLKKDRFVEQRAGQEPGYLLTKEFILEGKTLRVNAEHEKGPYKHPRMRVEIIRHPPLGQHWLSTEVYPGFGLEDCDPMALDHTDAVVTWKGKSDLSALIGKPVYLRFELQQMGLFSFRITKA